MKRLQKLYTLALLVCVSLLAMAGEASTKSTLSRTVIIGNYGYGFSPQHSGGFTVGQLFCSYIPIGWYAGFRSNFIFQSPTDGLSCGADGSIDGYMPFYTGSTRSSMLKATAGMLIDFSFGKWDNSMISMYLGGGYGYRNHFWELSGTNKWVKYTPTSYQGAYVEVGVAAAVKGFTMSVGVGTINFQYAEIQVGLGWTITHKKCHRPAVYDPYYIHQNPQTVKEEEEVKEEIQPVDVDIDIPVSEVENSSTFAVIIANENYQQVAAVPYALNDGSVFREYCNKTLGIPAKNIHYVANATGNNMKAEINWLNKVTKAYDGQAKVIFYYAGHGVPDEATKEAYLFPVDGSVNDISTGYSLADLYSNLAEYPAKQVVVLLDACFSGSRREEGMLASARGVALYSKMGMPQGNMVVLSAAKGVETAYPYAEKRHGMFTYFLLKKLQQSKENINMEDLANYVIVKVSQTSIVENGKLQTPTVTSSQEAAQEWTRWTLK